MLPPITEDFLVSLTADLNPNNKFDLVPVLGSPALN